jgi:hypothetical protein
MEIGCIVFRHVHGRSAVALEFSFSHIINVSEFAMV